MKRTSAMPWSESRGKPNRVRTALLAIEKVSLHRPLAFDFERAAGLEAERIAQCLAGRGGDVDLMVNYASSFIAGLDKGETSTLLAGVHAGCFVLHGRHRNSSLPQRLRLQLAFDLVQEAPVRAIGDDLFRAAFDHAQLVQPKRIKAHRV